MGDQHDNKSQPWKNSVPLTLHPFNLLLLGSGDSFQNSPWLTPVPFSCFTPSHIDLFLVVPYCLIYSMWGSVPGCFLTYGGWTPFWLTTKSDLERISKGNGYTISTLTRGLLWLGWCGKLSKLHARMSLSSHINMHKAFSKLVLQQAGEHQKSLEQVFLTDASAASASLVRMQTRLTDQLHFEKAKQWIFFSKQYIWAQWTCW